MNATRTDDPRVVKSKAAVLAAASELLAEHGLGGATVDAVAARSGVAKTTIYRHWPDRSALLLAAITEMAPPVRTPDSGDLRTDLVNLLARLDETLHESSYGRTLPSLADSAERDPEAAALLDEFGLARRHACQEVLRRAVAAGELPANTDVPLVHSLLVGPVFYQRLPNRKRLSRRQLTRIVDLVLTGVQAAPPKHP